MTIPTKASKFGLSTPDSDSDCELIEIDDENEAMHIINYFEDKKNQANQEIDSTNNLCRLSSNFNFLRNNNSQNQSSLNSSFRNFVQVGNGG